MIHRPRPAGAIFGPRDAVATSGFGGSSTMNSDRNDLGTQGVTQEDGQYAGARFSDVRAALFANPYYAVWGGPGEPGLPVHEVTLDRALSGCLPLGMDWHFQQAARRTIGSRADLRWGTDGRGLRRILHPNGVCLTGTWEIDGAPPGEGYSGYFRWGSKALIVGRYSTCCTETRRGHYRSLALVGKLYPTTEPDHAEPLRTANFFTQEDLGGAWTPYINDAELRNAPDTTPWRRGPALPVLLLTAVVLRRADKRPTIRQLYQVAELGKPEGEPTRAPEFMRLRVDPDQPRVPGADIDFRDEVLSQIYDRGDGHPRRTLTFHIEVSDQGKTRGAVIQRRTVEDWRRIGRIVFAEAVASYNGDFVVHFHHSPWRDDRNRADSTSPTHDPGDGLPALHPRRANDG
jgi:hypothetical protein